MKILHVTPSYYPATYWGGPTFTVYYMNNALARIQGVKLKVLTTDAAGPKVSQRLSEEERKRAFFYDVSFTRRLVDQSVSAGLLKALPLWVRWADVVHVTYTFSFPTIPTLILCQLYKKPLVWSLRGALLDDLNRHIYDPQSALKRGLKGGWLFICRRLIPDDRVALHVTSGQERDAVAKVYPAARFVIIPNGVEVPKSQPMKNRWLPDGKLRLMFMGRLAPKKGVENLLLAVAKLDMPISLDVYGTGTAKQGGQNYSDGLVTLATNLGLLGNKVRFKGHVDGKAKSCAFLNADVCVIPSYSESFCMVVVEALSMGMPVIVSNRLAWNAVENHGCGLVVANDPDSLANAIRQISAKDLSRMGEAGWRWMIEDFNWNVIAKQMYKLYQNMINNKALRPLF
jgi:glycosyltransferase involved in cell wall biosynthesis